jgi:hypothetical protein
MSENMEQFRSIDGSDGFVCKPFIHLIFQRGSVKDFGVNGCRIEDVIDELQNRILDHQGRELNCPENAEALYHLEAAKEALLLRRKRRDEQGVSNTATPHLSIDLPMPQTLG